MNEPEPQETVLLTVDLAVTLPVSQDPVEYVRDCMFFNERDGASVSVTDVFRNE